MTDADQEVRETPAAVEFAKWAIRESAFSGSDLSGDEVQEKAVELGLLTETTYDPEKHGPSEFGEPGMPWFEFGAALASAPPPAVPDAMGVRVSNADLAQMALCQVAWIEEGKIEHPHRLDTIRTALDRLAALSSIEPTPSPEPQAVLSHDKTAYDEWLKAALALHPDDQFNAATALAANVGCVLVNEPDHPDAPGPGGFERAAEAAFARSGGDTAVVTAEDYRASPETQASNARAVDEESAAKLIYEAMLWAREQQPQAKAPLWVEGGNSDAQYEARRFARKIAALSTPEPQTGDREEIGPVLATIRSFGWAVAVHNDYRLHDQPHTFWLFTHPDGRWVKGEGRSDGEALGHVIAAVHELDRAALRAKPEAQAIVGKEAGE